MFDVFAYTDLFSYFICRRINSNLEKVLRCVQDRHRAPQKPAIFPIALADMDAFERFDEDEYSNAVSKKKSKLYLFVLQIFEFLHILIL